MNDFQEKIGIANPDWLMSAREKLGLIGLLHTMKPNSIIELGYHRGGATFWLSKFAKKVITVDVNKFVLNAEKDYNNVESWNCSTVEALDRIKEENLFFNLAIIDADHSRKAVSDDVKGILDHADIILMHDSFNPECRKGMVDTLKDQQSHAYYLDFIPSACKGDGLWGGLALAWKSEKGGAANEFIKEKSPYTPTAIQNSLHIAPKINSIRSNISIFTASFISKTKILGGRLWRR